MKTQRSADISSGICLALVGLVTVLAAGRIKGSADVLVQPGTLPSALGWTLLVTGLILAIGAWRFKGADAPIKWPGAGGTTRVLVTVGSTIVYLALILPIGLPLSTLVFVGSLVWYLGRYRLVTSVAIGLACGATVFFVFIRLLELPFPVGPLAR